jgi:hypothetical protein
MNSNDPVHDANGLSTKNGQEINGQRENTGAAL